MRIAFDGRVLSKPGSGIVHYSYQFIEKMVLRHPENKYFLYVCKGAGIPAKLSDLYLQGHLDIKEIAWPKPFWRTKIFTDILDRNKVDLYHSTAVIVPYVPAWLRKVKVIQTCHGINPPGMWSNLTEKLYWIPTVRAGTIFSDRIICMSDDCKKTLNNHYKVPLSRMDTGYFGLNPTFKPLSKKEKVKAMKYLQKKYKLPSKNFIFYAGGTLKQKNIPTVIQTSMVLKSKYHLNLPIVITRIGNEYFEGRLPKGLEMGKDIIAIPWAGEDLNFFYNCAVLSIYPSIFEGLGYPIPEAMACGCPVICSNTSALPEAAGGAAILVNDFMNSISWADTIVTLYKDKKLQKKLIKLGLERARRFNWDRVVDDAIESYKKALDGK